MTLEISRPTSRIPLPFFVKGSVNESLSFCCQGLRAIDDGEIGGYEEVGYSNLFGLSEGHLFSTLCETFFSCKKHFKMRKTHSGRKVLLRESNDQKRSNQGGVNSSMVDADNAVELAVAWLHWWISWASRKRSERTCWKKKWKRDRLRIKSCSPFCN